MPLSKRWFTAPHSSVSKDLAVTAINRVLTSGFGTMSLGEGVTTGLREGIFEGKRHLDGVTFDVFDN